MDLDLIAKALLSLIALAQAVGPMRADLNRTHATNPAWTRHARFHVVWQVLQQTGVSVLILVLLWLFPSPLHTWIAAATAFSWIVTFAITLVSMPLFDGALADDDTGIPPFRFRLPGRSIEVDTNLFGAMLLGTLGLVAVGLLIAA